MQQSDSNVLMECPECGHDWTADRPLFTEDLVELMGREQLSQITDEAQRYQIFQVFRQRVFRRGYLPELAKQQYFDCFNALPHSEWYLGAIFGKEPSRRQMSQYKQHLATVGQRRGKSIAWIVEEFEKEFGVGSWQNAA